MAAGESALLLQIASPQVEAGALTVTTGIMAQQICETYQMPGAIITGILARMSGEVIGNAVANIGKNVLLRWFPGIGNAVNATTTYTLHQIQGRAIMEWCENNYDKYK